MPCYKTGCGWCHIIRLDSKPVWVILRCEQAHEAEAMQPTLYYINRLDGAETRRSGPDQLLQTNTRRATLVNNLLPLVL